MRSSLSFLVVSRSEPLGQESEPDVSHVSPADLDLEDHDYARRAELDVHIRVSYRTLLVVFLLFDAMRRVIDAIVGHHLFTKWL
jgi:hypothetical protein